MWHHEVRDHEVRSGLPKKVEPFHAVARLNHGVTSEFQGVSQQAADEVLVLYEEDARQWTPPSGVLLPAPFDALVHRVDENADVGGLVQHVIGAGGQRVGQEGTVPVTITIGTSCRWASPRIRVISSTPPILCN